MLTLTDLLRQTAQCYGTRIAIRDPSGDLTWQAYLQRVARTAGMLHKLRMRPGDRFATLSRNSVRHAELLLAGYWSGVIPVPLNHRLAAPEIAAMLEDAACRYVFVDEPFLPLFDRPELTAWKRRA